MQSPLPRCIRPLAMMLVCGLAVSRLCADSISLIPVADATLFEVAPSNTLGGADWIASGTTQNYTGNRAVMKFDVAGALPAGSEILGATLTMQVTGVPRDGFATANFTVRRLFTSWGEGTNVSDDILHPGLGSPAPPGAATWLHRFAGSTNLWTVPGGEEGTDFSLTLSAITTIEGTGLYTFESLAAAVTDVQFWLDHPESNFGWMLKCEAEEQNFTARRFASRELQDPSSSPRLDIDFRPPPQFSRIGTTNNTVALTFGLEAGFAYSVEFRTSLPSTNAWLVLTNLGAANSTMETTVFDTAVAAQRFYRVRRLNF